MSEKKLNKKYNRYELNKIHIYINDRGSKGIGKIKYEGYLKCKLVHNDEFSIIVPDLVFVNNKLDNILWFQVFSFMPNQLYKFEEDEMFGRLHVDISCQHTLQIEFNSKDKISNLKDDSVLYKCTILGPNNLKSYSTGSGKFLNQIPYIYLYHHTSEDAKKSILESNKLNSSKWNFQGTRTLKNYNFVYFTSIDKIITNQDLQTIAMSNEGIMFLMLDKTKEKIPIEVYRESTKNRKNSIKFLIDTTLVSNNHMWKHSHDTDDYVYYEFCSPFINRIATIPESSINFKDKIIERCSNILNLNYIVLGDATNQDGLLAPYDEERTNQVFKIEPFANIDNEVINFWFQNQNTDLYTSKKPEYIKFNHT
jgi:hypothetical protein